jgi:hypothetical protein
MDTFEQTWDRVTKLNSGEAVSPELRPLVLHVYERVCEQPPQFQEIKVCLENLLHYLTTKSGRTSSNCIATDLFFTIANFDVDWDLFPEILTDVIGDIGGALHDTISAPEIARNFGGLPEQLLERIKRWEPKI